MIAEKNVPRTIKNLNRIFYLFVLFSVAVSSVLIYFFTINRDVQTNMTAAIKVAHSRHSLLSEINYFVRKYQMIGSETLTYADMAAVETATKDKIKELSNTLQQVQFQVVESTHQMTTDIKKDITVKDITNYAITASATSAATYTIDEITSAYESTLFQYTSETFQVQNSSKEDVKATYLNPIQSDTTKNLFKAFEGIFHNGLRFLRSASTKVSKEIHDFYMDDIKRSFYMETVLVSCIGILITMVGTLLLIPTVFKVMRTTKLVLTLFGMIAKEDIHTMCNKCVKFGDQMLVENERDKKFSDEMGVENTELKKSDHKDEKDKNEGEENPGKLKRDNDDEPFDIKTEKPNPSQVAVSTLVQPEKDKKIDRAASGNSEKLKLNDEGEEKVVDEPVPKDARVTKVSITKQNNDKNKNKSQVKGKKELDAKNKKGQRDLKKDSNTE